MAQTDYMPRRDRDLVSFGDNFSTYLSANVVPLGIAPAVATTVATMLANFKASLAVAETPSTNSRTATITKDTDKAVFVAEVRGVVRTLQANAAVTPAQKTALGITVVDHVRTPIAPPSTKPVLSQRAIDSRSLTVRIVDELTQDKRSKPFGVDGAEVWAWVAPTAGAGAQPPADLTDWRFIGLAKRSQYTVSFRAEDAGKQAYVCAKWLGTRGEPGPVSAQLVTTVVA